LYGLATKFSELMNFADEKGDKDPIHSLDSVEIKNCYPSLKVVSKRFACNFRKEKREKNRFQGQIKKQQNLQAQKQGK
jgi:hypothetical protein